MTLGLKMNELQLEASSQLTFLAEKINNNNNKKKKKQQILLVFVNH